VALYVLIGYLAGDERSVEAAVKYLVLAGATSGFLLFGMGLVYVMTGQMGVAGVAEALGAQDGLDVIVVLGAAMLFVGVGFKLAVVPFHMWTPDVYEGAPTPVAAYIATVSKGAVVAVIVRFLRPVSLDEGSALFLALAVVAAASMIGGNVLALRQDNVKRILAYSSIAHLGYILVAFLATDGNAVTAVVFYLVAYTATNLVAFGVVSELSTRDHEAERLADYDGLARRRPVAAATMAVALFSLAGIPLTAGFLAKVYLLTAGTGSALWALVVILVLSSTIGLYYYTRIIVAMYVREPAGAAAPRAARPAAVVLVAFSLVVLVLGVYPGPLLDVIQAAASTLP
jgi:NADH-quinone oxidoreductase subunit N